MSIGPFGGDIGSVLCVAWSAGGERIVSGSEDGKICLWSAATGNGLQLIVVNAGAIRSITLSSDSKYVVAGCQDGTVRIFDSDTGDALSQPLRYHSGTVLSVAMAPQGSRIASGGADKKVYVCDIHMDHRTVSPESIQRQLGDKKISTVDKDGAFNDSSELSEDGWMRGQHDEKLFWVPEHCRKGFYWPRTRGVLGAQGTAVDLSKFVHGTEWTKCWQPSSSK